METFICDDCNQIIPIKDMAANDVCIGCLSEYPNETGWCSANCRINGTCDNTCKE